MLQLARTDNAYTYRRCEKVDLPEMAYVVNNVLETNYNTDYLEWKFFRNPSKQTSSVIAISNNRVIGLLGSVPLRYSVKGRTVTVAQELDFAILEEHRRFDLYLNMVSLAKKTFLQEKINYSYGFPNKLASEIVQAFTPKNKISPVPRLVKVINVKPYIRQRSSVSAFADVVSPVVNIGLKMICLEKVEMPEGMQIKKIERFDERFDRFWDRIKNDYTIMLLRDCEYLNWKYVDIKHANYEIFCLESRGSDRIEGFVVLGEDKEESLSRGLILEILTPRDEEAALTSCLIKFTISHFRQKEVDAIECWMFPHCHIFPELKRMDFRDRDRDDKDLYIQIMNPDNSAISQDLFMNRENWYLSIGDSDIY